jgi:AraC-like DNA-binding protein
MPVLPVPLIISFLLFGFFFHRLLTRDTHATLLVLIAACAVQGAIFALVQYYGFLALRPVQAIMATTIPPIAWTAFVNAAGGDIRPRKILWHALCPLLAIACFLTKPILLDAVIPLSFTGYGIAILVRLLQGEDSLLHSLLESGASALWVWRIVALSLIASAMGDVLIAFALAKGMPSAVLWVPSLLSPLSLLSLGVLSLTNAIESGREHETENLTEEDASRDQAIIAALDKYLSEHKSYLDPDLTLARLARKLVMPAKPLSAAINRNKNENVSSFINRHRIENACGLMVEGKSVTAAMFDSGFNTKSNFNREFLRVKGESPSKWLTGATKSK